MKKLKSFNESKLAIAIILGLVLVLAWFALFPPRRHNPELVRRVRSMSIMREIGVGFQVYAADYGQNPPTLGAVIQEYFEDDETFLVNPRDGFSGYHFDPPEVRLDEISKPSELAVLFEVRDDGMVAYDTGLIGYADGRVEYVAEPED
mgnify:CR=1 FL=1